MTRARSAVIALVTMLLLLFVSPAASASASTLTAGATSTASSIAAGSLPSRPKDDAAPVRNVCDNSYRHQGAAANTNDRWLPVNRWGQYSSAQDTNLDFSLTSPDQLLQGVARQGIYYMFSGGNFAFQSAANLTESANTFCIGDTAGVAIDKGAAALGQALIDNFVLQGAVLVLLGMFLWRMRKGARPGRQVLSVVVSFGLIAACIAGASATTRGPNGTVNYGYGSPGWFASGMNKAVTVAANIPADLINTRVTDSLNASQDLADPATVAGAVNDMDNDASCGPYTAYLVSKYRDSYSALGKKMDASAVTTQTINTLWMQTGLRAWSAAQFGDNVYANRMYCRVLENRANVAVNSAQINDGGLTTSLTGQKANVNALPKMRGKVANDYAFRGADGVPQSDGLLPWAACTLKGGKWAADSEFANVTGDHTVKDKDCREWFTSKDKKDLPGAFNWGANPEDIKNDASNQATVQNFLYNYHGNTSDDAANIAIAYLVAGIGMGLVFSVLGIAVYVAKIALLIMTFLMLLILFGGLFRSDMEGVVGYFKQYLGAAFIAFGATFVLSLMALISGLVSKIITAMFTNLTLSTLLSVIAPVASVFIISALAKKMKMPSPFKVTSGLAYANAASKGGIGGAVMSKVNGFDRAMDRAGRFAGRQTAVGALRAGGATLEHMGAHRLAERFGHQGANADGSTAGRFGSNRGGAGGKGGIVPGRNEMGNAATAEAVRKGREQKVPKSLGDMESQSAARIAAGGRGLSSERPFSAAMKGSGASAAAAAGARKRWSRFERDTALRDHWAKKNGLSQSEMQLKDFSFRERLLAGASLGKGRRKQFRDEFLKPQLNADKKRNRVRGAVVAGGAMVGAAAMVPAAAGVVGAAAVGAVGAASYAAYQGHRRHKTGIDMMPEYAKMQSQQDFVRAHERLQEDIRSEERDLASGDGTAAERPGAPVVSGGQPVADADEARRPGNANLPPRHVDTSDAASGGQDDVPEVQQAARDDRTGQAQALPQDQQADRERPVSEPKNATGRAPSRPRPRVLPGTEERTSLGDDAGSAPRLKDGERQTRRLS